jgi:hypothetical protein
MKPAWRFLEVGFFVALLVVGLPGAVKSQSKAEPSQR